MNLAGRYEILDQIGSGGMAYVYKARDRKLNRMVAIKVLKEEYCKNQDFVKKFRGEAQAAAGLSHINIVGVYDVGDEDSIHYIVMELVDGITLKDYITRKKKLGIKESIGIAIQVAQGLETAHAHHIVHRDIKPQNIIISRDARIKVTDFGIARAITDETTNLYGAAGSVHYISPEQARGGYCDERSDIYSLGITMYEMLTGKVPFDGDTTVAVAIAHINEEMTPPSDIEPSVPAALEDIIFKCTSKKPEQRYASCAELIKDLRYALVAPNERFVHFISGDEAVTSETVVMSSEQMQSIRNGSSAEVRRDTVELHPIEPQERKPERNTEEENVFSRRNDADDYRPREERVQREPKERKNRRQAENTNRNIRTNHEDSAPTTVDRVLTGIGATFGVIILGMMVFLIGSLNGFFRSGPAASTVTNRVETTAAPPQTTAAPVETTAAPEKTVETQPPETTTPEVKTEVPSVLGMNYNEAKALLTENNLQMILSRDMAYSDEYAAGLICRQDLDPGNLVSYNTPVTVYLSVGSDKFNIDANAYVGGSLDNLRYHLKRFSGVNVEYYSQHSDTVPKDSVLWLEPSEGYVGDGDTLKVYVSLGPEKNPMPYLIGKSKAEAADILGRLGFSIGAVRDVYSNTIGAGLICAQGYEANMMLASGTAVNLEVSLGAPQTQVPWVTNTNVNEYAIPTIQSKNLLYNVEWVVNDQPAGVVLAQNPQGDTWVYENTTVNLQVSSGPTKVELAQNAFDNMNLQQANGLLTQLNLYYEGPYYEANATVPEGTVIRWEPSSGNWELHKGNTVKLFISSGPGAAPPAPEQPVPEAAPEAPPAE